eukprot:TRINITY_DN65062_c0_g1_i1.p1 TRINITY_DN65062_c0_g1~~TRINITY_DN65062_c0_g1_i1.p1  ORF type:complete len:469 (+),score=26.62 TRINITY_DN65062_c0_g1_i1:706-2112(+)
MPDETEMEYAMKLRDTMKDVPCERSNLDFLANLCWKFHDKIPDNHPDPPDDQKTTTTTTPSETTTTTTKEAPWLKCTSFPNRPSSPVNGEGNGSLGVVNGQKWVGEIPQWISRMERQGYDDRGRKVGHSTCTATVIGAGWVLTAAHCVVPFQNCKIEKVKNKKKQQIDLIMVCSPPRFMLPSYSEEVFFSAKEGFVLPGWKQRVLRENPRVVDIVFDDKLFQINWLDFAKLFPFKRMGEHFEWPHIIEQALKDARNFLVADIAIVRLNEWNVEWTKNLREFVRLDGQAFRPLVLRELALIGYGRTDENDPDSAPGGGRPYWSPEVRFNFPCVELIAARASRLQLDDVTSLCANGDINPARSGNGDSGGPNVCWPVKGGEIPEEQQKEDEIVNKQLSKLGVSEPETAERVFDLGINSFQTHVPGADLSVSASLGIYGYFACTVCTEKYTWKLRKNKCWGCFYHPLFMKK